MSPAHLSPTPSLRQVASIPDTYECHLNMSLVVTVTVSSAPWGGYFFFSLESLTKKTLPGGERELPESPGREGEGGRTPHPFP